MKNSFVSRVLALLVGFTFMVGVISLAPPVSAQESNPSDPAGTEDVDCTGGGVLAWMLCPIFELGANITTDAFENVIKPMLENVPISTETDDPFYKAWSNFRLLGNIVLVGAMLVLVYAQARGGGS